MMTTKYLTAAMTVATAGLLAACGGGGSTGANSLNATGGNAPVTVRGVAQDGYLQNALVCLDVNINGQCDADEPSTMTGPGGQFSITDVSGDTAQTAPILVMAQAGSTIDEDTQTPVSDAYSMYAPPGYQVVNPITSLIAQQAISVGQLSQGFAGNLMPMEQYVAQQIFGDASESGLLKLDYISGQQNATLSAAQQQALAAMQPMARYMAQSVAAAVAATDPQVAQATTTGTLSLAAYQRMMGALSVFAALPADATADQVQTATMSFQTGLSMMEVQGQTSMTLSNGMISLVDMQQYPDWPTDFHDLSSGQLNGQQTVFDNQVSLTSAPLGSLTMQSQMQRLTQTTGGTLQWQPYTQSTGDYYWDPTQQKLLTMVDQGGLSMNVDSGGHTTYAGQSATVSLQRVPVAGDSVADMTYRFNPGFAMDQSWNVATFSPDAAFYPVDIVAGGPILSTMAEAGNPPSDLAPQSASTAGVTLPSGQQGTVFQLSMTLGSTSTTYDQLVLDAQGHLFGVTTSGTVTAIGTYSHIAAANGMPEMYMLEFGTTLESAQAGSSLATTQQMGMGGTTMGGSMMQTVYTDSMANPGAAPVIFLDGSGKAYFGTYQPAGAMVYHSIWVNDQARTDIENAITPPPVQ